MTNITAPVNNMTLPIDQLNQVLEESLISTKTRDFNELMRRVYEIFDTLLNSVKQRRHVFIDCKDGCSYCCELKVDATALEILYLARCVQSMTAAHAKPVMDAAATRHKFIQGKSQDQLLGTNDPCPLLRDGHCSAYGARPLFCRSFHAQTVNSCRFSHANPTYLQAPDSQNPDVARAGQEAQITYQLAVAKARLDLRTYDLGAALHEALTTDVESRFRAGMPAFSRASLTPE